jgi:hypothetical protein
MPDEISIPINTKQPYTQSPIAIIDHLDEFGWVDDAGIVHQQIYTPGQVDVPAILVMYRPDPTQAVTWQMKFVQLGKLKAGWNGYNAPAPSEKAIRTAESFVGTLLREKYEPRRLAPSAVGGVGVTQRKGDRSVYVEFYNDGRVLALFSDDVSVPEVRRVEPGLQSFKKLIVEMRDYLDA